MKGKNLTRSIPPADPRLAFWGIILVALGFWIGIRQAYPETTPAGTERGNHAASK